MLIGELSGKVGLSRYTIRFYEKQGLIATGSKENRFNTYKNYPEETLKKLLLIKKIKGLGFTLHEIAGFLELLELNSASCEKVSQKMFDKVEQIETRIKELQEMRKLIINNINNCNSENKQGSCSKISGSLS